MSVFPTVMVVPDGQDPAREGAAARMRSIVAAHGYALTDDPAGANVLVRTDGTVLEVTGDSHPAGVEVELASAGSPVSAADIDDGPGRGVDLLARVNPADLTATGTLTAADCGWTLLSSSGRPAVTVSDDGRTVTLAIRPDAGHSFDELLFNAITFAAGGSTGGHDAPGSRTARHPAWLRLKSAVADLQSIQSADGSVPDPDAHAAARAAVHTLTDAIVELAPLFPHDTDYLAALVKDVTRWADGGFGAPDFLDSLVAFHPERDRVDGREHLVLFPMYTQNGSTDRHIEAVLVQVIWPDFIAELESGDYSNKLFVPIRFLDFTPGYDTNSAVLFPETVAMREVPKFTWGAIFADREAARFRTVISAAAETTKLALPPDAARLLEDQQLTEETFVMWDLIHDRTHMHGDLPFDPFMIKQRMPYFLYSLCLLYTSDAADEL